MSGSGTTKPHGSSATSSSAAAPLPVASMVRPPFAPQGVIPGTHSLASVQVMGGRSNAAGGGGGEIGVSVAFGSQAPVIPAAGLSASASAHRPPPAPAPGPSTVDEPFVIDDGADWSSIHSAVASALAPINNPKQSQLPTNQNTTQLAAAAANINNLMNTSQPSSSSVPAPVNTLTINPNANSTAGNTTTTGGGTETAATPTSGSTTPSNMIRKTMATVGGAVAEHVSGLKRNSRVVSYAVDKISTVTAPVISKATPYLSKVDKHQKESAAATAAAATPASPIVSPAVSASPALAPATPLFAAASPALSATAESPSGAALYHPQLGGNDPYAGDRERAELRQHESAYWTSLKQKFEHSRWYSAVDSILLQNRVVASLHDRLSLQFIRPAELFYNEVTELFLQHSTSGVEPFLAALKLKVGAGWDERLTGLAKAFYNTARTVRTMVGAGKFVGGALQLGKATIASRVNTAIDQLIDKWDNLLIATDQQIDKYLPDKTNTTTATAASAAATATGAATNTTNTTATPDPWTATANPTAAASMGMFGGVPEYIAMPEPATATAAGAAAAPTTAAATTAASRSLVDSDSLQPLPFGNGGGLLLPIPAQQQPSPQRRVLAPAAADMKDTKSAAAATSGSVSLSSSSSSIAAANASDSDDGEDDDDDDDHLLEVEEFVPNNDFDDGTGMNPLVPVNDSHADENGSASASATSTPNSSLAVSPKMHALAGASPAATSPVASPLAAGQEQKHASAAAAAAAGGSAALTANNKRRSVCMIVKKVTKRIRQRLPLHHHNNDPYYKTGSTSGDGSRRSTVIAAAVLAVRDSLTAASAGGWFTGVENVLLQNPLMRELAALAPMRPADHFYRTLVELFTEAAQQPPTQVTATATAAAAAVSASPFTSASAAPVAAAAPTPVPAAAAAAAPLPPLQTFTTSLQQKLGATWDVALIPFAAQFHAAASIAVTNALAKLAVKAPKSAGRIGVAGGSAVVAV